MNNLLTNRLLTNRNWKSAPFLVVASAVLFALMIWMLANDDVARLQAQTPDEAMPLYSNMDPLLNELAMQPATEILSAKSATAQGASHGEGTVGVIFLTEAGTADELRAFLQANGAAPGPAFDGFIGADVPVSLLAEASRQDGVNWMQAIIPPTIPTIAAQANPPVDTAPLHGAEIWHQAGVKGEGVKVGIISSDFKGFRDGMGDTLPSFVEARCYIGHGLSTSDIAGCADSSSDGEVGSGKIAAEAVFSIAPEATYYIAQISDRVDYWDAARWMADNDVDVIHNPFSWVWTGPGDGTSPLTLSDLNVVDEAVDNGITWVTAAGNDAKSTWFGAFEDTGDNGYHNFDADGEDECNSVSIGDSAFFYFALLRWEGEWSGTADTSSTAELIAYLVNEDTSRVVASSYRPHWAEDAGIPLAYLPAYVGRLPEGNYCIKVQIEEGEAPDWLQLQSFLGEDLERHTLHGSIGSPAESANPGAIAVGTASLNAPDAIWEHSSRGPAPDGRIKPDIVGGQHEGEAETHGVEEQHYTPGSGHESAHVAGLAALVKQRFPQFSPEEVADYLKTNAEDRGEPGPDNTWGHGFAMLPAADAAPPPDPDACVQKIYGGQTIDGNWDDSCVSETRPNDENRPDDAASDYYARFYTLSIGANRRLTATLTSDNDSYLYLLDGAGSGGSIEADNDDMGYSNRDSRIAVDNLEAGEYTIEATTYASGKAGAFNLLVQITDAGVDPETGAIAPETSPIGPFTDFSRGADHVCALRSNGTVACWGDDRRGQSSPPSGEFRAISSGERGSCALRDDGAAVCWGSFEVNPSGAPAADGPFTEVSRGSDHACALSSDGTITCWGSNEQGQATPPSGEFSSISSHAGGSCALRNDYALVCWGNFEVSP